jgi:hypothetical protein
MIVMVLVASAVTLLATHFGFRTRLASQEARRIHLVALTDAVVAESIAKLDESASFEGVSLKDFGGGTLSSEVESLSTSRRVILATSSYRGWTRQVRVQVRLHMGSIEVESWSVLPPS